MSCSSNLSDFSRRHFLRAAGALASATLCGARVFAGENSPPRAGGTDSIEGPKAGRAPEQPVIQIGILLGTYSHGTLERRLDAVKDNGLDCIQLSLDCAGMPAMPDELAPDRCRQIQRAAAARGITIASVQGTFNMSHPEADHRRTGLKRLEVLANACPALGASKIHLCTGTRDRDNMWRGHPDNDTPEAWRDMSECVAAATAIAARAGAVLAFEPEVNNVVNSARKARRLLDQIGSPNLKVTFDAANFFQQGELPRMREILQEAITLLGKDVVLAHAKDLDHDGDAGHLPAGYGKLDYDRYVELLHGCGFKGPLLLHGLSEAQVPGCVAFLRQKIDRLGTARAGSPG